MGPTGTARRGSFLLLRVAKKATSPGEPDTSDQCKQASRPGPVRPGRWWHCVAVHRPAYGVPVDAVKTVPQTVRWRHIYTLHPRPPKKRETREFLRQISEEAKWPRYLTNEPRQIVLHSTDTIMINSARTLQKKINSARILSFVWNFLNLVRSYFLWDDGRSEGGFFKF
jgi:hypothetical protein